MSTTMSYTDALNTNPPYYNYPAYIQGGYETSGFHVTGGLTLFGEKMFADTEVNSAWALINNGW